MAVIGLQGLINKLDKLSNVAADNALEKACLMVEAEAKKECPVDDGQLRQSITYEIDGLVGAVGTNVEYAPYVHQGTGIYAVNGDGRKDRWSYQDEKGNWHSTIGQQPQPFLERGLDNKREDIIKEFQKEIRRALQ